MLISPQQQQQSRALDLANFFPTPPWNDFVSFKSISHTMFKGPTMLLHQSGPNTWPYAKQIAPLLQKQPTVKSKLQFITMPWWWSVWWSNRDWFGEKNAKNMKNLSNQEKPTSANSVLVRQNFLHAVKSNVLIFWCDLHERQNSDKTHCDIVFLFLLFCIWENKS